MDVELITKAVLFVAPLYASAVTLAAMHWYPSATVLPRTTAYALGTLVTVGIPAAAMIVAYLLGISCGELFWAALLLTNALLGGGTVNTCYWIDSNRPITLDEVADANADRR